ncbi:MAG TPA: hypothetical protein VFR23_13810 [Jiangellaceae bacterium]|nr:hypothetical protein [Jiangellaceae bacterium]
MAVITPKVGALSGVDPLTYVSAAGGGDTFPATGDGVYLIHVKNGHTSAQSIVIDDPNSASPPSATTFVPDVTVSVPNAGERMIVISNAARFMSSTDSISLTYPLGVVSLTLQVVKVL